MSSRAPKDAAGHAADALPHGREVQEATDALAALLRIPNRTAKQNAELDDAHDRRMWLLTQRMNAALNAGTLSFHAGAWPSDGFDYQAALVEHHAVDWDAEDWAHDAEDAPRAEGLDEDVAW